MLLAVEHLSKKHNVKCIVKDVGFAIEERDKIALIGVNGTGKTTLLAMLAGNEHYDEGSIIRKNGLRIAFLQQEPVFDEEDTILHQILVMDKEIKDYEAKSILGKLGIRNVEQPMSILSGGQRKRVALARALLQPCDLLMLDEPTNHLDNTMIEWLETYLKRFSRAILMVTHDRYFLERVCTRMMEIDHGNVYMYDANYSTYLEQKAQREEIAQASERKRQNILRKELAWMRAGVQARGTKSKERIDRFHRLNDMEKPGENGSVKLDTLTSRLGRKTIEWKNLGKAYGEHTLFQNFSYQLKRNDRIGILGPNGCGKSTLLHILAQELAADGGDVVYGETVRVAYFKQGYDDMDMNENVIEYIRHTSNEIQTAEGTYSASQMLERFLFDAKSQYIPIAQLSGGERRRLYLLKVLMQAPNILFLDEPTNDLDIATLQILEDYLDNFNGALIVVSHDRYFLDRICDTMFVFEGNGNIRQHIGGYSTYIELADRTTKREHETPKKKTEKVSVLPRLTSKEKKELETMDYDMECLQDKIVEIDGLMSTCTADFSMISKLSAQREQVEQQLEDMMERWLCLSEKQAEIDALKHT